MTGLDLVYLALSPPIVIVVPTLRIVIVPHSHRRAIISLAFSDSEVEYLLQCALPPFTRWTVVVFFKILTKPNEA